MRSLPSFELLWENLEITAHSVLVSIGSDEGSPLSCTVLVCQDWFWGRDGAGLFVCFPFCVSVSEIHKENVDLHRLGCDLTAGNKKQEDGVVLKWK